MSVGARSFSLWPLLCAAACVAAVGPASGCSTSSNGGTPPVLGSSGGGSGGVSGSSSGGGSGGSGSSSGGDDGSMMQGDAMATDGGTVDSGFDAGHYDVNLQDAVFTATDEGVPEAPLFPDGPGVPVGDDASGDGAGD